jgi:hypothetical protein
MTAQTYKTADGQLVHEDDDQVVLEHSLTAQEGDLIEPGADLPVPEAGYPVPEADHPVPEAGYLVPEADHPVPEAGYLVPEADHLVPEADHLVPEADHLVPEADQTAPEGPEPESASAAPRASRSTSGGEPWHEIQAMFVDDPRASIELAAGLVDDRVEALVMSVRKRQQSLQSAWQGDNAGTEELRIALQHYRTFWNRLEDSARES